MVVTVTAKIKIKPDESQIQSLLATIRAYRQGCNFVSSVVYGTRELKLPALHQITYRNLRSTIGLRSQMAQSVMKTVMARYKTNQSNGHDWVQVQFKKPEYDLVWNRDYSLTVNRFSVNTLQGRVKISYEAKGMEQYFDGSWMFGTAKLVHKHGKWFLHIPMSKEVSLPKPEDVKQIAGVDLGINFVATVYDNEGATTFFPGRAMKRKRANYKRLRRQLQRKQTPSARRRLKQIGQRETRWMTDVNHQVSKALVARYGANTLFVLEDLKGVRQATEKARVKDRYVAVSWAFHQLRKMVEYKAQLAGSIVIAVSPAHTSQACPKCGSTAKANRNKRKHHFCCKTCGYQSNDDRIAAMNLTAKGQKYLYEGAGAA